MLELHMICILTRLTEFPKYCKTRKSLAHYILLYIYKNMFCKNIEAEI